MKPRIYMTLAIALFSMVGCSAQKQVVVVPAQTRVVVEATNYDISYDLDLEAVATLFGSVNSLQEFERKLNDYGSRISNLDLNYDGRIDYLRVVETFDRYANVIIIQAVLDINVYQDVATVVVEKSTNTRTYVQIIGSPYLYGRNYIIEPVYIRQPPIYRVFRSRHYVAWQSPYYWGYYPTYYHYVRPVAVNIYVNNVRTYVNHQHSYNYTSTVRYQNGATMQRTISRNDYGTRYPERTFTQRNNNVSNSYELRSSNSSSGSARGNTTTATGSGSSSQRNSTTTNATTNRQEGTHPTSSTKSTVNSNANNSSRSADAGTTRNTVNDTNNSSKSAATGTTRGTVNDTNNSSRSTATGTTRGTVNDTNNSSRSAATGTTRSASTTSRPDNSSKESSVRNNSNTNSTQNSNSGTKIDNTNSSRSSGTQNSSSRSSSTNSNRRDSNSNNSGSSSRSGSSSSSRSR